MLEKQIHELGSYYYGEFRDNELEYSRLSQQAFLGIPYEKEIWKKIPIKKGMKVLDLASGLGIISSELAKFVYPSQVIGFDKNPIMIDIGNKLKEKNNIENLIFKSGDAYSISSEFNDLDIVYSRFLFQHVERPLDILQEIYKSLKIGGKVCIIDIDDDWLSLIPEPKAFKKYLTRVQDAQLRKGGNRFIGSQLPQMMKDAGFEDIQTSVEIIDSKVIGLESFLHLILDLKMQLVDDDESKLALDERNDILSLSENKFAYGCIGMFCSFATKTK